MRLGNLRPRLVRALAFSGILAWGWLSSGAPSASTPRIDGAWATDEYVLKDGTELDVSGHIFFTDRDWTVLFFVMDDAGERPKRGSGEGGSYELDGDTLTFTHHYHLSTGEPVASLPAAELRMTVTRGDEAAKEPCRVAFSDGDTTMTIYFPSGNRMSFRRR